MKFVICLRTVYFAVVPLAHIIWCSGFWINGKSCIARDICDVAGDSVEFLYNYLQINVLSDSKYAVRIADIT